MLIFDFEKVQLKVCVSILISAKLK